MRDSWINFRRQDANAAGVRIANWEEMDLGQYVWFNGDIQRVVQMPRGPDADMIFSSNNGKRRAYFDTTATAHALDDSCYVVEPRALDDPCYVVEPRALAARLTPNGLPVFTLFFANDDDGDRALGSDSRLLFTAPAAGRFLVRVTDTRGMNGDRFAYRLTIRPAHPDFSVAIQGANPTVAAGAGASFGFRAERLDGFDDAIRVEISGLPPGYFVATPIVIQPDRLLAETTLFAASVSSLPNRGNTGWVSIDYVIPAAGSYRLEFGVRNVTDSAGSVIMGVDAARFTAAITSPTAGEKHIGFAAMPGLAYTIQYKNALTDAAWLHLADIAAPAAAQAIDYNDTSVGLAPQRFYRVVTPQVP